MINSYFTLLWRIHCWWWNVLNFITVAAGREALPRYSCCSTVCVNHSSCLVLRKDLRMLDYIFFFFCNKLKPDLNIFYRHFVTAHSASPESQSECALSSKPVHTLKKKKKRIVGDIFTSCVFLWCCFLKNNINHSDFLSRRKRACEWLPFGFPCLKKKNLHGQKKKKKNAILPLKLNISAGHTEWWVNQREGFFPSHHPTRTHTREYEYAHAPRQKHTHISRQGSTLRWFMLLVSWRAWWSND